MVCFEIDDYINDRDASHWFADLSNGKRVFGDDGRPGLEPNSWFRLRDYLYAEQAYITMLWVRFRSNAQQIGSSDEGYFFRKGLMANVMDGINHYRFVFGLIENGKIVTHVWNVPEIIKMEEETEVRDIEGHEESIIWNSPTPRGVSVLRNIISLN